LLSGKEAGVGSPLIKKSSYRVSPEKTVQAISAYNSGKYGIELFFSQAPNFAADKHNGQAQSPHRLFL
jgi:hypothetical protein